MRTIRGIFYLGILVVLTCTIIACGNDGLQQDITIEMGPPVSTCMYSYIIFRNDSYHPINLEGIEVKITGYQIAEKYTLPYYFLVPGNEIHYWPGNGTNNDIDLYANGSLNSWNVNLLSFKPLFWRMNCDIFK